MPKLTKAEENALSVLHTALGKILGADQEEPKAKPKAKATGKTPAASTEKKGGIAEARKRIKEVTKRHKKGEKVNHIATVMGIGYSAISKIVKELEAG